MAVTERTRTEIWQGLWDAKRMVRYYQTMHKKYQTKNQVTMWLLRGSRHQRLGCAVGQDARSGANDHGPRGCWHVAVDTVRGTTQRSLRWPIRFPCNAMNW